MKPIIPILRFQNIDETIRKKTCIEVLRTEQIWIKKNDKFNNFCHLSKNLYNDANYLIRQEFFKTGKWLRYNEVNKLLQQSENYKSLPAATSQQNLRHIDSDWKSFFNAMKEWKKNPNKFTGMPKCPKYKEKNGNHILIFTNQQVKQKNGWLLFPKKIDFKLKIRYFSDIREVRLIPQGIGYIFEIVYKKTLEAIKKNEKNIIGIDLGINNLITMVNNIGKPSIIVKGGIVKSINQFFNKRMAELQSIYSRQKIFKGNKSKKLLVKRNRKMHDFFHKTSSFVINHCQKNDVGTLVIGYNESWKQNINLGKKFNQKFVQIPFLKLVNQLKYKAEEHGINVIITEESYTSKCSFLDNELSSKKDKYKGKRIHRGLFKSSNNIIINADVNAAFNIVRKVIPNAFLNVDGIEGVVAHPLRINICQFE